MISIRWHLTLLLCAATGALFVLTCAGVFVAARTLLLARFDETLTAKARALITASEIDDGEFEIDMTVQDFAGFGHGGNDYFEIRRAGGQLFLSSPSLAGTGAAAAGFGHPGPAPGNRPAIIDTRLADGRPARVYLQRFQPKDDARLRFQDLYLAVASPTRALKVEIALLATVLGVAGAAALLLLVPVVRLALNRGLRPLGRLAADLAAIQPDNLRRRLPADALPAELVPVAQRLNEWLARLEASFERERRFTSHAAHELRTPLAELKGMAELAAMFPEEATPERCAGIVAAATTLENLLERLFMLARADAGRWPVQHAPVDLAAGVAEAVGRAGAVAQRRRVAFDVRATGGGFASDPVLWGTLAQNLIDNAAAHAPEGSVVVVEASPQRLAVANPAPDLAPADMEHLFERFWRKDKARSGHDHAGLGLSIVRTCAALLGGTCTATLSPAGDLRVEVAWPPPAAADAGDPAGPGPAMTC